MNYVKALGLLVAALAAMPATSYAQQQAYTSKNVNLRAGPARDYPAVAILPPGFPLSVNGCLSGYQWCDVGAGPNRGWVYAGNIVYPYQGANVPLLTYGATIGIGVLGFNLGNYWDQNYRGRPWYSQRQSWANRPRPTYGQSRGQRPPVSRPPQSQRPPQAQRPQQGQRPQEGQRPPQAQRPQQGQRPQEGRRPNVGQPPASGRVPLPGQDNQRGGGMNR